MRGSVELKPQKNLDKISLSETRKNLSTMKNQSALLHEELENDARINTQNQAALESKMAKLQETGIMYAKRMEIENKLNSDLEREIEYTQKELKDTYQAVMKVEGLDASGLTRVIKQLEHQYEKTMQNHNEGIANNRQLKEEINTLRRERVIYDNIYAQFEVEMKKKANELLEAITEAELAMKERKAAEELLAQLKLRADREDNEFKEEYNRVVRGGAEEVKSLIQDANKPSKPIDKNGKPDVNLKLENTNKEPAMKQVTISKQKQPDLRRDSSSTINKPIEPSTIKKRGVQKREGPQDLQKMHEEVVEYEMIFDKLKKETNLDDIDEIVRLYNNHEQENQRLFAESNAMLAEAEKLEKQLSDLDAVIAQYENNDDEYTKSAKKKLEQLKSVDDDLDQKIKAQEELQKNLNATMEMIKNGIPMVIDKISGNREELLKDILDDKVTDHNLPQFLGVIEKRISEVAEIYKGILPDPKDFRKKPANLSSNLDDDSANQEVDELKDFLTTIDKQKDSKEQERILTSLDFKKKVSEELSKREKELIGTQSIRKKNVQKPTKFGKVLKS